MTVQRYEMKDSESRQLPAANPSHALTPNAAASTCGVISLSTCADAEKPECPRPHIHLRPYFFDKFSARPSLDGLRFFIVGRAEDRNYFLIDIVGEDCQIIEREFPAEFDEVLIRCSRRCA